MMDIRLYAFKRDPDGFYVTKPTGAGFHHYRGHCPECYSTKMKLENYTMSQQDGDVICAQCGTYIRMYDAG